MRFDLVDRVLELTPDRIVTIKQAEVFAADFPGFPVLPGVLMVESLVQAGRRLIESRAGGPARLVLGGVRALKYGNFVRPGETLRVEVTLHKANDDGTFDMKGEGTVARDGGEPVTAVSGRFTMRPLRLE